MSWCVFVFVQFDRLFSDPIVSVRAVGDAISLYPKLPNHEQFQKVPSLRCATRVAV